MLRRLVPAPSPARQSSLARISSTPRQGEAPLFRTADRPLRIGAQLLQGEPRRTCNRPSRAVPKRCKRGTCAVRWLPSTAQRVARRTIYSNEAPLRILLCSFRNTSRVHSFKCTLEACAPRNRLSDDGESRGGPALHLSFDYEPGSADQSLPERRRPEYAQRLCRLGGIGERGGPSAIQRAALLQ
jgi:hypothetical protein